MNKREKLIICGLFLSKFNQKALDFLGLKSFTEAFNVLGYSLGSKPSTIKNYRDELDPYFPNERKGWHKRPLRMHCAQIYQTYHNLGIERLGGLVKDLTNNTSYSDELPDLNSIITNRIEGESSYAKRLITGKAAEEYFSLNFNLMDDFHDNTITNTTNWGCGFDFKMTSRNYKLYKAVEVKGLRFRIGQIQLTDLEFSVAKELKNRYFLVVVKNFVENPIHTIIKDPVNSNLRFVRIERQQIQTTWCTEVKT